jgi:CheY-like chemotaxis protein
MSGEACNIDHLNISPGPFWLPMINRLTSQGFNVIAVADGPSALLEITKLPADPVLMDVLMPNLNGFEACEQIKANPDTHPVILVPALSDRQDRLEGVRVGADDFLSRPSIALN